MKDLEVIPEKITKLENGDEALLLNQVYENSRVLLFMSPSACKLMKNCIGLQMDGTFKTTPNGFRQVYILFSLDEKHNVSPIMYCLLPCKDTNMYKFVLEALKTAVGEDLCPAFIMIDFEISMIEAVNHSFPDAELSGCNFHFKQVDYDTCIIYVQ